MTAERVMVGSRAARRSIESMAGAFLRRETGAGGSSGMGGSSGTGEGGVWEARGGREEGGGEAGRGLSSQSSQSSFDTFELDATGAGGARDGAEASVGVGVGAERPVGVGRSVGEGVTSGGLWPAADWVNRWTCL